MKGHERISMKGVGMVSERQHGQMCLTKDAKSDLMAALLEPKSNAKAS